MTSPTFRMGSGPIGPAPTGHRGCLCITGPRGSWLSRSGARRARCDQAGDLRGPAVAAPLMVAELEALRAALPGYDLIITSHTPTWRFEAIRRHADRPGPWCVISSDPGDLWLHLAGRLRPPVTTRAP